MMDLLEIDDQLRNRFWGRVDRKSPDECWDWKLCRNRYGYGNFRHQKRTYIASRLAWLLTYGGPIDGMDVCHKCDNPGCCNPAHMFLGTRLDNMRDCVAKGRQTAGEGHGNSKLSEWGACGVMAQRLMGFKAKDIGASLGVSPGRPSEIYRGIAWKHLFKEEWR